MLIVVAFFLAATYIALPFFWRVVTESPYALDSGMAVVATCMVVGMMWLFCACPVAGLGAWIASLLGRYLPKGKGLYSTEKLASLRNAEGVAGTFFLGTGSIGSAECYVYYIRMADGSYSPRTLEVSNNTRIFEEKREDGELKTYRHDFEPRFLKLFAFWSDRYYRYTYEFRIPTGSLKQNFKLE
jgi:hypothetical protein